MRKILYIILIGLVFLAPVDRLEIAKLEPVEAVAVEVVEGVVTLTTDTRRQGRGATVAEALKNLKENTPAVVYLDTTRFLLLAPEAQLIQPEITPYFKPKVIIAPYGGADVKEELAYLKAHRDSAKPIV